MQVMTKLGVPYTEEDIARAQEWMLEQGAQIEQNLMGDPEFARVYEAEKQYYQENGLDFVEMKNREVVAIIAYLQRLGTDIKILHEEVTTAKNE